MQKAAAYWLIMSLAALSLWAGSASAAVIIEDFSNAAIASYTTYGGNMAPAGSAHLPGWDLGGRYFKFEDVASDRVMAATGDYGGYDIGMKLAASSNEYRPVWDPAQAAEALSLEDADDLLFDVTFRFPVVGQPVSSFLVTLYYYDTSAGAAASVTVLSPAASSWALNQTKTFTVDVDAISGFDKTADKVYGFRMAGVWSRIGLNYGSYGLSQISYTQVPEPATLALLAGGLLVGILRRRA